MPPDRATRSTLAYLTRYAAQHPLQTIEHCILIICLLRLLEGSPARTATLTPDEVAYHACPAGQRPCCCPDKSVGQLAALTAPGVEPAPPATIEVPSQPGEVAAYSDFRGSIYRFPMGDGIILNLMHTVAGSMRSGDMHNCTQFDIALRGRSRLHQLDVMTGKETVTEYDANELIVIPARKAHLFEYVEDSYMIEWWACDFKAWYYEPYRKRIAEQFRTQQAAWQASNAAATRQEEQPARQVVYVASVEAGQEATAADGDQSAASSVETGAGSASQRASETAGEQAAAATGAADMQRRDDNRRAEGVAAAEVSDQQQGSGARQQGAGISTDGQTEPGDPSIQAVARQSDAQAVAASGDAAVASESMASLHSDPADPTAVSKMADASRQHIDAETSLKTAQLRGGGVSSIRLGERT